MLRLLPTGAPDERYTLQLEPGKPVPSVNIPQFRAPFCVCLLSSSPLKSWTSCLMCEACYILSSLPYFGFTEHAKGAKSRRSQYLLLRQDSP